MNKASDQNTHQTALIHSLVTLNISDQWTRSKVQLEGVNVSSVFLG